MVETEMSSLLSPWLTPTSLFVLLNIVLGIILFLNSNNHPSKNQSNNNYNTNNYDYRTQDDGVSLVPPPPQLTRAPSLFSRVSSFNFSQYYSEHVPTTQEAVENTVTTLTRAPSLLYRVASFKFSWASREGADAEGKMVNDNDDGHHDQQQQQQQKEEEVEVTKVKKVNNKKKKVKKEAAEVKETTAFRGKSELVSVSKPKETTTAYLRKEKNEETTAFKGADSKLKETTAFKGGDSKVKETTSLRAEDEQVDSKADDFINRFKQQLKMQRLESMIRNRTNIAAN